jgi:hypothetical protein
MKHSTDMQKPRIVAGNSHMPVGWAEMTRAEIDKAPGPTTNVERQPRMRPDPAAGMKKALATLVSNGR